MAQLLAASSHAALAQTFKRAASPGWRRQTSGALRPSVTQTRMFSGSAIRKRWIAPRKGTDVFRVQQNRPQRPSTSEGLELEKSLTASTADPIGLLKNKLASGTVDLETARICLHASFTQLRKLPRKTRSQHIKDLHVGSLTLQWLWSEDQRWASAVVGDLDFMEMLCFFCVAEGNQDLLIEWAAQPLATSAGDETGKKHQWRGQLLRLLVRASLFLNHEACADPTLRMFFRVADRVKKERRRDNEAPLASVSLWPAEVELTKELCMARHHNTDPRLWEQYEKHLLRYSARSNEIGNALLRLCHPTKPDTGAAVMYIRQHMGHLSRDAFESLFQRSTSKSTFMYMFFRRTAEALHEKGLLDDASYVKQRMEDLFDEPERERLDQKYLAEQYSKGAIRKKSYKASKSNDKGSK
ncbi:hypothetical protein LTR17_011608 [Elasticomyces elasticus]|nr:hypothetical protein LTR17_011608 [Elasticomyces elasticus]